MLQVCAIRLIKFGDVKTFSVKCICFSMLFHWFMADYGKDVVLSYFGVHGWLFFQLENSGLPIKLRF